MTATTCIGVAESMLYEIETASSGDLESHGNRENTLTTLGDLEYADVAHGLVITTFCDEASAFAAHKVKGATSTSVVLCSLRHAPRWPACLRWPNTASLPESLAPVAVGQSGDHYAASS